MQFDGIAAMLFWFADNAITYFIIWRRKKKQKKRKQICFESGGDRILETLDMH